jgi:hypothetical protein
MCIWVSRIQTETADGLFYLRNIYSTPAHTTYNKPNKEYTLVE